MTTPAARASYNVGYDLKLALPLALLFGVEALEYRLQTAGVKAIVTGIKQKRLEMGPRAWAYRLEEREKLDRRSLTEFQRFAWREAMKNEPVNTVGHHTPIPERMLPPAMREPA